MEFQVGDGLAEIKLCGSGKTVVTVSKIHLVRIHREDLRLGVTALDLQRKENFLHLAPEAAVAPVEEKIPGQLHADGAGPACDFALDEISGRGAEHAREVDPPVFFEMLVLDGGYGRVQHLGTLLVSHQDAALQREAPGELAVIGVHFGDHVRAVRFQRANFRQVAGVNKEQAAARAQRNRAKNQKSQRDAVNQFPAAQSQRDRWQVQHENTILAHKRIAGRLRKDLMQ